MTTHETEVHLVLKKPISQEMIRHNENPNIRVFDRETGILRDDVTEKLFTVLRMKIVNPTHRTVSLCNFSDEGGFYINYIQFRNPSTGLWETAHRINMEPMSHGYSYDRFCGNDRHHVAQVIQSGKEWAIGGHFDSSEITLPFVSKIRSYRVGRSYFIGEGIRSDYDCFHCTRLEFNEGEGIAWSKEMLTSYGKFFVQETEASAKLIGRKQDFEVLGAALSHRHVSNDSDIVSKFVSYAAKAGLSSVASKSSIDQKVDGDKKMRSTVDSPARKGQPKDHIPFGITSYGLDCEELAAPTSGNLRERLQQSSQRELTSTEFESLKESYPGTDEEFESAMESFLDIMEFG